ncbi:MAG: 4-hydroxythreonine-4-phosphate dehydrogenase PdxA [Paracoccaceae bacterium]
MRPELPVALTCGEPAGIGAEITVLAWQALRGEMAFFLIGDAAHLPRGAPVSHIDDPGETAGAMATGIPVLPHEFACVVQPGRPEPANARSVIEVIARAVDLVTRQKAAAVCTNPVHKKALIDGAGFAHHGHTEYLAELAGGGRAVMMLASDALRVVPVTVHVPLAKVPATLSRSLLKDTIRITRRAMVSQFDISQPRIAVAGLNPHAGEGGEIGREEALIIAPVLEELRAAGMDIDGPLAADTMFHKAARARYDVAICMYHDQALIPIKTLAFDSAVNVTLGLPFVRTSPDHGTAFDIAGQGVANPASLIAALRMARRLTRGRAD